MAESPLAIAVATRAYPGETVNGDAWRVDWHGPVCRVSVVDGLGHGPEAAAAAAAATSALAANSTRDVREAIACCHEALKGTRGAAILVACIDVPAGQLTIAGVGNVEACVWQAGRSQRLVTDRGIVGSVMPRVRPIELALTGDWRMIVYSDGVSSRFDVTEMIGAGRESQELAEAILATSGRMTDDATVVIAQPLKRGGSGASGGHQRSDW
jgi:serine phosphatase RsbU (regulator of sigma subunit)